MKNVMHACDISNQSRALTTSRKWSSMVMEEFWEQGDFEVIFATRFDSRENFTVQLTESS